MAISTRSDPLGITAAAADGGQRLDRFLAARLPQLSRSRLQALIRQGAVREDGRTIVEPDAPVKPGAHYQIAVPAAEPAEPAAESIPLNVVFEDAHVIVIDKPAGLVVHPAAGNWSGTLVNALIAHCGATLSGIGGVRRPGIVHRLDKETSGLMVVAKTDLAHASLAKQFADHGRTGVLERRYRALVWGVPTPARGRIEAPIGRHPHQRHKMTVRRDGGRAAVTYYGVEAKYGDAAAVASLVECRLETGRTHQVRVHMAHIGHPLIADRVYGAGYVTKVAALSAPAAAAVKALGRHALHAAVLAFAHPQSGETIRLESPLPEDMAMVVTSLSAHGDKG